MFYVPASQVAAALFSVVLWFTVGVEPSSATADPSSDLIEGSVPIALVSGAYWRQLHQVVIYESTMPLIYKSYWPTVDEVHFNWGTDKTNQFCKTMNSPECIMFRWTQQVNKRVGHQIHWLNESIGEGADSVLDNGGTRARRSIKFLGDFMHYCCSVATNRQLKPLFATQRELTEFTVSLQRSIKEAFLEIDNVTQTMNSYSADMETMFSRSIGVGVNITKVADRMFARLSGENDELNNKLSNLLQLIVSQGARQLQTTQLLTKLEIITQCREKKIPSIIVKPKLLFQDLTRVEREIRRNGFELAIPPSDVSKYLKLELADCQIAENNILINIRVPVRRQNAQWKLYELIATPFAWKNNTCYLQQDAPTLVAVSRLRVTTLKGRTLRNCQTDHLLCYVPRHPTESRMTTACHRRLFQGATIQELTEYCVFSCSPGNRPLVSQVEEDTYIVTHAAGLMELKCRHGNSSTKFATPHSGQPGALEIRVPCDCSLIINNHEYVSEVYPCVNETYIPKLTHVIPASWSRIKSLKLSPFSAHTSTKFETFAECLDTNWPSRVPHINLSFAGRKQFREENRHFIEWHQNNKPFWSVTAITQGVIIVILSIIVIRNPYLVGFGTIQTVTAANSEEIDEANFLQLLIIAWTCTVICFSLWTLSQWAVKTWRTRNVNLSNNEFAGVNNKPLVIPLDNLAGKEITISVESKGCQTEK